MFTVYSKPACPYCDHAKTLLKSKDIAYEEVVLNVGQAKEDGTTYIERTDLLLKFPDLRTMPVILEDGRRIGGYTELRRRLDVA
jgi:glutaredoxin 3